MSSTMSTSFRLLCMKRGRGSGGRDGSSAAASAARRSQVRITASATVA